jgi:hypothetical protein
MHCSLIGNACAMHTMMLAVIAALTGGSHPDQKTELQAWRGGRPGHSAASLSAAARHYLDTEPCWSDGNATEQPAQKPLTLTQSTRSCSKPPAWHTAARAGACQSNSNASGSGGIRKAPHTQVSRQQPAAVLPAPSSGSRLHAAAPGPHSSPYLIHLHTVKPLTQ